MRFALPLTLLLIACGDDTDAAPCEPAGDTEACDCGGAIDGYRVCLDDGQYTGCVCNSDRTVPCSDPGAKFACRCGDGTIGVEVCLRGGDYTACDCAGAAASDGGAGPAVETPDAAAGCPASFVCTEQMGFMVCTDAAGLPPICSGAGDCAAAGLPDAQCIDPAALGVTLCLQTCSM